MNDAPIGIFDSGLGGLTVARAIIDYLPGEDIVYLGDTANTPYGPKPIAQIRDLTIAGLDTLVERGCKVLVIACNTGTAAALADARERYSVQMGIPVVEVITPAAREAALTTRNGRIGVIGTEATVASQSYPSALVAVPGVEVFQQACPEFVDFVERGVTTGPELEIITREYLSGLKAENVDTVILGCTHYPLLQGALARELGEGVNLVTSSEATAREVYLLLVEADLLHSSRPSGTSNYRFLMTAPSDRFTLLARRFLGPEVGELELVVRSETSEDRI
ncbi:MAG: glutamate racemase [Scrofimicrobium sp.]